MERSGPRHPTTNPNPEEAVFGAPAPKIVRSFKPVVIRKSHRPRNYQRNSVMLVRTNKQERDPSDIRYDELPKSILLEKDSQAGTVVKEGKARVRFNGPAVV